MGKNRRRSIWCLTYALMSFYTLTKNWSAYCVDVYDYDSWQTSIEPFLKISLKPNNFNRNMRSSLPTVEITDEDVHVTYDFVSTMLRWNPNHRPLLVKSWSILSYRSKIFEIKYLLAKNGIKITNPLLEEW